MTAAVEPLQETATNMTHKADMNLLLTTDTRKAGPNIMNIVMNILMKQNEYPNVI